MKTDQLIELLARGAGPAPRGVVVRRLLPVLVAGTLLSAVISLAVMGPLPPDLLSTPVPWLKALYGLALLAGAGWGAARLARPLARVSAPGLVALMTLLVMLLLAARSWSLTPGVERLPQLMGHSWLACPWNVLVLSLPTLAGSLWALRGLAPTRLRAAGFAAGAAAGAAGAVGYAFACPEPAITFVAVWYTAGIGLAGALGAWLGPRWLRW